MFSGVCCSAQEGHEDELQGGSKLEVVESKTLFDTGFTVFVGNRRTQRSILLQLTHMAGFHILFTK